MTRFSNKQYGRRAMLAMAIYIVLLLALLPYARRAEHLSLQILYALLPLVPVFYVIWLMAKRIWLSDELEQRLHLIGLGAATAVVAVFTVLSLDSAAVILIWIFPLLMLVYAAVRAWAARRYGSNAFCEDDGMPMYLRFLIGAGLLSIVAVWAYFHSADAFDLGLLVGLAAALALGALILVVRRWRSRRSAGTDA
jgi:hypothetical protein